jgi:hypothetical protein
MATATGMRQAIKRIKRAWAEMDYAQRRLFEIRSGIPVSSPKRAAGTPEEVQAWHALERHAARP